MLEVSGLSRSYGDFLAVDDVSFSIGQGEIVGLLGHNGAGKTTIMKMLSGYLEPDAGTVTVDKLDLAKQPKQVQHLLGYLPENLPVYPEMTVGDYLDYAAYLKNLHGQVKDAEIKRAVKATDIGGKILAPIATLSRGYKQRVGVAQAILGRPRLLILDEPTNGLDPTQTDHMRQLIRELSRHATVILSTHIMQEVEALCDRVLIVNSGRLVVDEKLANLRQSDCLELVCNLGHAALRLALASVEGIGGIHGVTAPDGASATWHRYELRMERGRQVEDLSADVATAVIAAQGRLAALKPQVRNLETLFREVSESKPVIAREERSHA